MEEIAIKDIGLASINPKEKENIHTQEIKIDFFLNTQGKRTTNWLSLNFS